MLQNEDLSTFSKIGRALWADPEYSERSAIQTLSAISLLDLTPESAIEKACGALLECAKRGGNANNSILNSEVLGHRFFRLSLEERLVLASLHGGHWSYERLGRILHKDALRVEEMVWSARLKLCPPSTYPSAPSPQGPHCPDYNPRAPWTQRFLDDEIPSSRERLFLQNHLLVCEGCRKALSRCRDAYFKIEKEVSEIVGSLQGNLPGTLGSIEDVFRMGSGYRFPTRRSFRESLSIFSKRSEVVWMSAILVALVFWKLLT